ncbi:hypothetical protein TWF694_003358 [Orbilia ellipsospora]|uniref:LAGLIDADG endonuclease n=1 Tax=Orbilia ellipsospora TaxID=2528407 RepID=A0AAV9WXV6_9PEZI
MDMGLNCEISGEGIKYFLGHQRKLRLLSGQNSRWMKSALEITDHKSLLDVHIADYSKDGSFSLVTHILNSLGPVENRIELTLSRPVYTTRQLVREIVTFLNNWIAPFLSKYPPEYGFELVLAWVPQIHPALRARLPNRTLNAFNACVFVRRLKLELLLTGLRPTGTAPEKSVVFSWGRIEKLDLRITVVDLYADV